MKTKEQVEKEFMERFIALCREFGVTEIEARGGCPGYPECGEDIHIRIDIPATWDENGEWIQEWTDIDLGTGFRIKYPEKE